MHAGEIKISILLVKYPEVIRRGNDAADWIATDRPNLMTLGMAGYTKSGVIGRPSLGTAPKGHLVLASLADSFRATLQLLSDR